MSFIPFNLPTIEQDEIDEVVDTLKSGWLTTGPKTARFERDFQAYVDAAHALALNSGTAGLHLALVAMGIGPGDEVITTPLTFCSTVNVILQVGATPVLADVGPDGNIDPASIEAKLTERTRAVVPVHLGGLPCDMIPIWQLARQHGIRVVEDAAHALGTHYRGRPIGSGYRKPGFRSEAVCFSFYATKNLTTGEGGMVVTDDDQLYERMKSLALHGVSKDAWDRHTEHGSWYYEVTDCGFKYNLSDVQSAIGIHQLAKQERFVEVRTQQAEVYSRVFDEMAEIESAPDNDSDRHCWHLYSIRLNLESLDIDRDEFIRELHRREIGASVHFIPIPLHPVYAELRESPVNQCPRALELYPRLVSLPLYPRMTEDQLDRVVGAVKEIVYEHRRSSSTVRTSDRA